MGGAVGGEMLSGRLSACASAATRCWCTVPKADADALRWARSARQAVVVDAVPRYLPGWTRPLVRIPLVREFLTWNLLLVLRREG